MRNPTAILIGIYFIGCAHPRENPPPQKISLRIGGHEFSIGTSQDPIRHIELVGHRIWHSSFPLPSSASAPIVIERRKAAFTSLFKDEINPYTLKKTPRSQCLRKVDEGGVTFLPGPDLQWSDCHLNSGSKPARRFWLACNQTLWEITVQPDSPDVSGKCG